MHRSTSPGRGVGRKHIGQTNGLSKTEECLYIGAQIATGSTMPQAPTNKFAGKNWVDVSSVTESELSFFLKLKEDIVNRTIPIRDGYVEIADLVNVEVDPVLLRSAAAPGF